MHLALALAAATAWSPASTLLAAQPPSFSAHRPRRVAAAPRAAEQPFRSDDSYDYFRKMKVVQVTLEKPLGAVLEACPPSGIGAPTGVKVEDLQEGGSAAASGLLKKGDRLRTVNGEDVTKASFDEVMDVLVSAPPELDLMVGRVVVTRKPRAPPAPPPTMTVDGAAVIIGAGDNLRTALTSNKFDLYPGLMAKANQCGGVGQCNLCWVDVVDGADNLSPKTDFERKRGAKKPESYRMSCQALVNGDVSLALVKKK